MPYVAGRNDTGRGGEPGVGADRPVLPSGWYAPGMPIPRWLSTVLLLVASNAFMTTAWYYHLKQKGWSLGVAILVSWLIALPEYALQVPANRIGHVAHGGTFTAPQLKIVQEAITLVVFGVFSIVVLKEKPRGNDLVAFGLIVAAVVVAMTGKPAVAGRVG